MSCDSGAWHVRKWHQRSARRQRNRRSYLDTLILGAGQDQLLQQIQLRSTLLVIMKPHLMAPLIPWTQGLEVVA